ncbi:ribonuclease P protein subunit p40 [Polymixia lowei]
MYTELEKTPRNVLVCEKSNFENEKARLSSHVEQHYFNHKVSVLLPECDALPPHLDKVLNSFSSFYLVKSLPVYELLEKDFLETVVYKGSTYCLSYRTRIDEDNTFALLPSAKLVLSVDKDTYERLGLEGKPSCYSQKPVSRYVVTVDLKDRGMAPGGHGHQRILTALREQLPLQSDFLLAKHDSALQEGGAMQSLLSRYEWSEHRPQVNSNVLMALPCPPLLSSDLRGDHESCDPQSFLEWLGAIDAGISCHNRTSGFLSTFICPEPETLASQALRCSISGLLLPEDIYRLVEELRRFFDQPKRTSWLALTVHGFMDSPVSWGTMEHGFLKGGENFYSLVLFQNHDYWLYMGTGSNDGCPP